MIGVLRTIIVGGEIFNTEHRVNESKHVEPVKQKKRSLEPERNKAIHTQVKELTKANILKREKASSCVIRQPNITWGRVRIPGIGKAHTALVYAIRKLRRYFQAHPIKVLSDKPIKQILARPKKSRRIAKWAIELGEQESEFRGRNSIKGQILADFLDEPPLPPPRKIKRSKMKKTKGKNQNQRMNGNCSLIEPQSPMTLGHD
nr:RVT_3 domain-containing protein [Tanacetum cinerariifolium]